jgi:hypothetical protein
MYRVCKLSGLPINGGLGTGFCYHASLVFKVRDYNGS